MLLQKFMSGRAVTDLMKLAPEERKAQFNATKTLQEFGPARHIATEPDWVSFIPYMDSIDLAAHKVEVQSVRHDPF